MSESTYALMSLETGKTDYNTMRYGLAPLTAAPAGYIWSYIAQLRLYDNSFPPSVDFHSGTASGEAIIVKDGCIEIYVKGLEPRDIKDVVRHLRERIGCQTLNPRLYLPDNLKTPWERFMYSVHWIFSKK